jgi:ribose 5-phosphate isomerase A
MCLPLWVWSRFGLGGRGQSAAQDGISAMFTGERCRPHRVRRSPTYKGPLKRAGAHAHPLQCYNHPMTAIPDPAALKRDAAARALDFIKDGMKVGLGTGSTADAFLDLLAPRVAAGLKIIGTPTSQRTADKARSLGIPIQDLDSLGRLDVVIDGADEADRDFNLIKGGGGAHLREKIVAASSARMVVIADDSKLVDRLGAYPLPIEVAMFAHGTTAARIKAVAKTLGYADLDLSLRQKDGAPYVTDNGNYIYDGKFKAISDAPKLSSALSQVTGVVEHGLFIGLATAIVLAGVGGVRVLERP